jgi:hypothetical protein
MYREASKLVDDSSYPGFELKTYILMVMSILKQNYCSAKYLYYLVPGEIKKIKTGDGKMEQQVLIPSKEEFTISWNQAVNSIDKTLKSLKNSREFGAISSKFLPYPSIIPALSAIKTYVKDSDYENKADISRKIKKWYWASIFLKRYSSSVETTSAKDFVDLKKWFSNDDLEIDCVSDFIGAYKTLDLQKEINSGSAIYKAIFNLIIINGARDWESNELPEYEDLDDHHIVPKSWGRKMGIPKEINSILNRTPISGATNRKVLKDQLPNVYLKNMLNNNNEEKVYEVLASHLINRKAVDILLRDNFTVDDYYDFLKARKKTIINQINKSIIDDSIELPEDLLNLNNQIEEIELFLRQLVLKNLKLENSSDVKERIPSHILEKINQKLKRERKRNPALVEEKIDLASYWLQFLDLQELLSIITSKLYWHIFESSFGSKEKLNIEFNDVSNLRNALRHSREVDKITQMKGEASLMWFNLQLKI